MSSRRSAQPIPGQETFLVPSMHGRLELVRDFTDPPAQETGAYVGPAVNLAERNIHLANALTVLGKMSQRSGLMQAVETPHRRYIEVRYGAKTDEVASGAGRVRKEMEVGAKTEFAKAFGLMAMQLASVPKEEGQQMARREFSEFTRRYADSHNRTARDRKRKQLEKNTRDILKEQKTS